MIKKLPNILFLGLLLFLFIPNVYALTGTVNVNTSLSLRSSPSSSASLKTSLYNGSVLNVLDTNAGSGNGCNNGVEDKNWYKVEYNGYTGYSCSEYIVLNNNTEYSNTSSKDGTIMCYEDTGSITLRNSANGSKISGRTVDCGEEVSILDITETKGASCPYWYKIDNGKYNGYLCGYYVNTTKLSATAQNYYNNKTNGDTIESYKTKLTQDGFPESYHPYLLELHARHSNWNFISEKLSMSFSDAVDGESGNGASLLEWKAFDKAYLSMEEHSYNLWTDEYIEYESEPGYYNASKEAIAYYMDPRNYLNEKYIFAFETLGYSANQDTSVVSAILNGISYWPSVYNYYSKSGAIQDSKGNINADIVDASSKIDISAVHVATRINQEIRSLTIPDSRLGGTFTYNGASYSNYYNFFNIKSSCANCSSPYAGYAYEKGWNTPYKGIYGGASFMYNGYISLNQDTIYYEKFDVSTTNGHYTHQYMQNLAAPVQEGGSKYDGYFKGLNSYFNTAITFVIPVYDKMPDYAVTAPKLGSNNNYLRDLTINGSSVFNFSYNTYNYDIFLAQNTTSVTIDATKMINSSTISGIGTIPINADNQTNQITVTSESGKTRIYTINFIRESIEATTVGEAVANSGFKYNDNYLFGINEGTNVSQIIGNISNYNHAVGVAVKDRNGTTKTNDIFKTGDKVTISGKDGSKTYTVLIYGDVNGDGKISAVDYVNVKKHIIKTTNLTGEFLLSADVNKDGKITAVDYVQIKNNIIGKSKITQ